MISMRFNLAAAKANFFDRKIVKDKVKAGTLRALSKAGAFVRRTAKGSIRSKKKISGEGQAPSSHTGKLKDFIFFGLDPDKLAAYVGPIRLNSTDGTAPGLLEKGGTVVRGGRPFRYRRRPFMNPALEKEAPKFPGFFTGEAK